MPSPFMEASPVHLSTCPVAELHGCDLVFVAAGVPQMAGESRLSLVQRNVAVFQGLFPALSRANPRATIVIVTNPVDVMTRVALELSGHPPERLLGTGTLLDSGRFRQLLSEHLSVTPRNIHAHVVGEHGDHEVLVWSRTLVGPFTLDEYCRRSGVAFDQADRARIDRDVRQAAYQIIERKGATHFAIGQACARLAQALARPMTTLLTVSRRLEGQHCLEGICLSLPVPVNEHGVGSSLELDMTAEELAAFLRGAEVIEAAYAKLGL